MRGSQSTPAPERPLWPKAPVNQESRSSSLDPESSTPRSRSVLTASGSSSMAKESGNKPALAISQSPSLPHGPRCQASPRLSTSLILRDPGTRPASIVLGDRPAPDSRQVSSPGTQAPQIPWNQVDLMDPGFRLHSMDLVSRIIAMKQISTLDSVYPGIKFTYPLTQEMQFYQNFNVCFYRNRKQQS